MCVTRGLCLFWVWLWVWRQRLSPVSGTGVARMRGPVALGGVGELSGGPVPGSGAVVRVQ